MSSFGSADMMRIRNGDTMTAPAGGFYASTACIAWANVFGCDCIHFYLFVFLSPPLLFASVGSWRIILTTRKVESTFFCEKFFFFFVKKRWTFKIGLIKACDMNCETQYMTPGLAKVENIAGKFDAWRKTASKKLVTRVWPIAWWHCYKIPKPPTEVLLADTPRLHDSEVIAALMACGWPYKVAHRVGKATNDVPVRGYSRAMGKAGFGLVHSAKNSGDAYYERYYCPKQTQTTKRNYEN